jgi:hypothetical protein
MIKSRRMKRTGIHGEKGNAYRILVQKSEGKRLLVRRRHRCGLKLKLILREVGWDGMNWIDLAEDRDQWRALVNMLKNLHIP